MDHLLSATKSKYTRRKGESIVYMMICCNQNEHIQQTSLTYISLLAHKPDLPETYKRTKNIYKKMKEQEKTKKC